MIKNRSKPTEDGSENENLILKNSVIYIAKNQMRYLGKQNNMLFFQRSNKLSPFLIIIQQKFSINRQMKYIKKWEAEFENVFFMNKCNYFIAQTGFKVSIWKIDRSYNLCIIKNIFTYEKEINIYNSFLLLNENDNLIITSIYTTIYILIKEKNDNWKLQQRIKFDQSTFIQDYRLNDKGNIFILSQIQQIRLENYSKLLVVLRVNGLWRIIKEISMKYSPIQSCCFLDNDKFIFFYTDCNQQNLSIWQIFLETLEVKQLKQQKLEIQGHQTSFKFMKQRDLLIAHQLSSIFIIKEKNNQFSIQQKIILSEDLVLADIINEEMVVLHTPQARVIPQNATIINTIWISKLY